MDSCGFQPRTPESSAPVSVLSVETGAPQRSRYNYFVDRPDGLVMGYNARTGTFAIIVDDVAEVLRGEGPLDGIRDVDDLIDMGFLHSGNELDRVIERYEKGREPDGLNLTIAPAIGCNFSCSYYYQNEHRNNRVMSTMVQEATLRFVAARVSERRKSVSITWY